MNKKIEKKWFSYFINIRNKYNTRTSKYKPLIINLISNTKLINNSSFEEQLKQTAKFFSNRYNCLAICGKNEISFIFKDSNLLIESINDEKRYKTHDIVSIFSQYFFEYFNNTYSNDIIFWNCKCFNIKEEKIDSYLKFKKNDTLFLNGDHIDFNEYLNGNILIIKEKNNSTNFLNLSDFDDFI